MSALRFVAQIGQVWSNASKLSNMGNMTVRRHGAASRTRALARAADAVARRDAARIEREKSLQAALTDFFQAQGAVERIYEDAAKAAEPHEGAMRAAVRAIDGLDEPRAGIAELTGLSAVRVREYLAAAEADCAPTADGRPVRGTGSAAASPVDDAAPATAPVSA
jgi:hypothetical protein